MVRNGLGVDTRSGYVRAVSATNSKVLVVVDGAPFLALGEALREALASARAKFGEPEAIAVVHDDDLSDSGREELLEQAKRAGLGEVRLVAESTALPYAEGQDLPAAALAAAGAAIWLLRERRGVIVPPVHLVPPTGEADEGGRKMDDFGEGRRMSDFGAGSTMSDHGEGRKMEDFGKGRTMADFGAGAQMADFGETSPRRRRSRIVVAALAAAIVVIAGAVAAVGLSGPSTDADNVAATDSTVADSEGADETESPSTTDSGDHEPGARSSADEEAPATTTSLAGRAVADGTSTTSATAPSTTVPVTTASYAVTATVDSYSGANPDSPRLQQGMQAPGVVTMECNDARECTGTITIRDWSYQQQFEGTRNADGSIDYSRTEPRSECVDGATVTNTFSATVGQIVSGQTSVLNDPQTCKTAEGQAFGENISISFNGGNIR